VIEQIPTDWRVALSDATSSGSFEALTAFVTAERARRDTAIYPKETDVFAALRLTPLARVRAVIIGQDPYHGEGQAHGLAFSCLSRPWPPSLRNILDEWQRDLREPGLPPTGSLELWARHGVLLLNVVLTVRQGEPDSHRRQGWEKFTDAVVRAVASKPESVAFLLWGRKAQRKAASIREPHFALRASHPSPFSVRGFRNRRPFTTANRELERRGAQPIDWTLSTG
jgi:uracil-DNA glycosylase